MANLRNKPSKQTIPERVRLVRNISKWECTTCGNYITKLGNFNFTSEDILKAKSPEKCSCGRRGYFRLLLNSLEKIDFIEESRADPFILFENKE